MYIKGVRKQKGTSKFSYRIHCILPDGNTVAIEKGSFVTPEEASAARKEKLVELTTQECDNASILFDTVFEEYMLTIYDKPSLQKKYYGYYNSYLKDKMDRVFIGECLPILKSLQRRFCSSKVSDNRSPDRQIYISSTYLQGLKELLYRVFDFAYNKKYIKNHPMYQLEDWTAYKKKDNSYIEPLFAYLGNKYKILPDITKFFPEEIDVFIDAFAGSAVVGINANANKVIINEPNHFLLNMYKALHATPPEDAWNMLMEIVEKYDLRKDNEEGYYTCRNDYNAIPQEERETKYWYWGLCLVYHSFNRSTVQHNLKGEYNAPFGHNKVNLPLAKRKFLAFANKLYQGSYIFTDINYNEVPVDKSSFIYLDPPYLITTATYNKFWDEEKERGLYLYLEQCTKNGIKWALSNVLSNNGIENRMLRGWIKEMQSKYNNIHLYYLESDYTHSNFRRKNRGRTVEILLTNY